MHAWDDNCLRFAADELALSDSVLLDRLRPLGDEEAASIEALCEATGPGALVVDDVADGNGVVVATLPDGRHIISLTPAGSPDDPGWVQVHARLFCRARCYLLRLLDDRRRWQRERAALVARIESLEAARLEEPAGRPAHTKGTKPRRPR